MNFLTWTAFAGFISHPFVAAAAGAICGVLAPALWRWHRRPRIKLEAGFKPDEFFHVAGETIILEARATVVRGVSARNCSAYVIEISREGKPIFQHDNFGVRWSRKTEPEITLHPGATRPISIARSGLDRSDIRCCTFLVPADEKAPQQARKALQFGADYSVVIMVTSDNAKSKRIRVPFKIDIEGRFQTT